MPAKSPAGLSSVHTRANFRVPPPCAKPPDVVGNVGQRRNGELKIKTKDMYLEKIDTISLSKAVLIRLSAMEYEKNHKENNGYSSEQLIFPMKIQKKAINL